jgi:hypothetical protein
LAAGGLVILCLAGAALVFGLTSREIKPASAAAEAYVAAVIAGDDARALGYVCTEGNSKASHDDFTSYVRSEEVTGHKVVDTNVSFRNLSWRATVHMALISSDGSDQPLTLPLAKERGEWKVCSQ